MKIYCKHLPTKLSASSQVNKVGRYLYKHIDSAFKCQTSSNTCDVYFTVLYEVPDAGPRYKREDEELHEMTININITTYQNKLRINMLEVSPKERTLGHFVISPENLQDLEAAKELILSKLQTRLDKVYEEYDFIY